VLRKKLRENMGQRSLKKETLNNRKKDFRSEVLKNRKKIDFRSKVLENYKGVRLEKRSRVKEENNREKKQ
jgi:hypothetical protein